MIRRLAWLLLCLPLCGVAAEKPQLWGYGVKGCKEYLLAWDNREQGSEFGRFQDWLTGLVTGLSLATGKDVLHGVEMDAAMQRIQLHCEDHPDDDFFNASMALIRLLSVVDRVPSPG